MPQETLRNHPLCRAEDLGKSVPDTTHAISMCLPRWQDVVGYEEKDPETMKRLQLGYPRFFYHPLVEQAFKKLRADSDEAVQIYTTRNAAERCKTYLAGKHGNTGISLRAIHHSNCALISFPEKLLPDAKDYWQHTGEGISSRCAENLLTGNPPPDAKTAQLEIISRIAEFTETDPENIYLFPSGMAAINAVFLAAQEIAPNRPSVQFAFPYGDTLKLQNKLGQKSALFYPRGNTGDLKALESELAQTEISGLFCEFPSNPLLTSVDLSKLRELADKYRFPIIIDETLGACINQNTLPVSDLTVISLTKFFSGGCDVMGGALIINPEAPFAAAFKTQLDGFHEPAAFFPADLIQLEINSRDFRQRVEKINATALAVCEYLQNHPAVETVFYPAVTDRKNYDRFKLPGGGYGGLFSFVLKNAAQITPAFYDALEITKGPNLGTSFSLCCPFTLIAHYNELEWAESAGASRWLIRISAGLEPADELIARIERAFSAALPA